MKIIELLRHPCNSCLIKPICKEAECDFVKNHYEKLSKKINIYLVLIGSWLFTFGWLPMVTDGMINGWCSLLHIDYTTPQNELYGLSFIYTCALFIFGGAFLFKVWNDYKQRIIELKRFNNITFKTQNLNRIKRLNKHKKWRM